MSSAIDLGGRRALVTGASRGIGAAAARALALAGAAVCVHYRAAESEAQSVLASLAALGTPSAGEHFTARADLVVPRDVEALAFEVERRFGRLDILVNNAGVWSEGRLADLSLPRLQSTFALNLEAPFSIARAMLPLLARGAELAGEASIVNVGSTAGQRGEAGFSAYAASKGALHAATKSWAVELAPRIRVNCVAPGWVETDMTAGALAGGAGDTARSGIPLGRIASAQDIAGPILFLVSPLARHVTGEVLNVNGGSVLCG